MYGVKHTNLAKLYVSALSLEKTSSAARQLLEWKRPTASREGTGDLATVVYSVVRNRCLAEHPTLTVCTRRRAYGTHRPFCVGRRGGIKLFLRICGLLCA